MRAWGWVLVVVGLVGAGCQEPPPVPVSEELNEGEIWARQQREALTTIVTTFAGHVREGRTSEAYAMTASGYRQVVTEEAFAAGIARAPYLAQLTSVSSIGSTQSGGAMRVRGFASAGSDVQLEMGLTREGEEWKITSLSLGGMAVLPAPGASAPPPAAAAP